jgi:hypothetical protein
MNPGYSASTAENNVISLNQRVTTHNLRNTAVGGEDGDRGPYADSSLTLSVSHSDLPGRQASLWGWVSSWQSAYVGQATPPVADNLEVICSAGDFAA